MSIQALRTALNSQQPYNIAKALELPPMSAIKDDTKIGKPRKESLVVGGTDWTSVVNPYLEAVAASKAGDIVRCYQFQSSLHSALNQIFASSNGNILVPAIQVVCRNSHHIAAATKDDSKLQHAVTLLQESFSKCLNDRTEFQPDAAFSEDGSKKAGVLYIVNQLFAMYFALNTLRLCKNLVRPVETRKLHQHGRAGDLVTYRYYVGRLYMFEDQYDMAETHLEYALKHCHKDALTNKKAILRNLVPVKLLRGRFPTLALLQKYQLHEFIPLVESIYNGNLRAFNDGLTKYQDLFIRRGIYLLLEKCKTVCYRNLLKRFHHVLESKPHLSLLELEKAFKWLGVPMDLDEVECILANLIYRGYIRGYISHTKHVLVLSKKDPFPTTAVILSKAK